MGYRPSVAVLPCPIGGPPLIHPDPPPRQRSIRKASTERSQTAQTAQRESRVRRGRRRRKAAEQGLTGVGHGDLADFIGVEPDLALAALEDTRGEALLELERHHLLRRR
jgi:hypothetical protein